MDHEVLKIYTCKISRLIANLKGKHYPDKRLVDFQDDIIELFDKVKAEILSNNFTAFPSSIQNVIKDILDSISMSIEFLEDSILNAIPFETVYCLERALKEWTDEEYLIVTSLKHNDYFFQPLLSDENFYSFIDFRYGIKIRHRLIQISIPKNEANDYLFNVVLYHELGHFIDSKYLISQDIINNEFKHLRPNEQDQLRFHYGEYFSDIFAAQYIENCSSTYLNYIASNSPDSFTHPATVKRIELVNNFLANKSDSTLDKLKKATLEITNRDLQKRFSLIPIDDFINLLPPIIKSDSELHSLFIQGWLIWYHHRDKFGSMDILKIYKIINNLIEKSISNYMVTSLWTEAHVSP